MARIAKRLGRISLIIAFLLSLSACAGGNVAAAGEKGAQAYTMLKTSVRTGAQELTPVLYVYHTHSFETYAGGESIIEIGKLLADYISETYGVKVIHDTAKYGEQAASRAYADSLKGLEAALKSNPEITHFLDIHRDAGLDKRIVKMDGKELAPVNLIVGKGTQLPADEKPNYAQNHAFALAVQEELAAKSPDLAALIEKDGRYNQHLPGICMLVDIGLNTNSLEEAARVIPYLAEAIVCSLAIHE